MSGFKSNKSSDIQNIPNEKTNHFEQYYKD